MTTRDPRFQPRAGDQVLTAEGKALTCIARDGDVLIVGTQSGKELPGISVQTWRVWTVGAMILNHADLSLQSATENKTIRG